MSDPANEKSFWHLFHEAREERLPVQSNVYDLLNQIYKEKRVQHEIEIKSALDSEIHPTFVKHYNQIYYTVQNLMRSVLNQTRDSKNALSYAEQIYSFRLAEKATVADLLATDIFGDKTVNLDIPVPLLSAPIGEKQRNNFDFLLNTFHYTLHWPQRTEFLFLHELIVGYLGNLIQHDGYLPPRSTKEIISKSYWTIPAYMVRELAFYLNRTEAEVVTLHFETNEGARKLLPQNIQDLLLLSSHITWYIDLENKRTPTRNEAKLLRLVYSCFFLPSLEKLASNPNAKLRADAGTFTDQIMCHSLLGMGQESHKPLETKKLVQILLGFADVLWV
jgi:hypothetical protein